MHLNTVIKSIPIFIVFDRTNYARLCSLYLQDVIHLDKTKTQLYAEFIDRGFTIKQLPVSFTSFAGDQGLEQTINRSQKSSSGINESTKKKYVAA